MITFAQPSWLWLAIPVGVLAVYTARRSGLRWVLLGLGLLALADPRLHGASGRAPLFLLVDRSRSTGTEAAREAHRLAEEIEPRGRPVRIVTFGAGATEIDPSALDGTPLAERSDLAAGLDLVAAATAVGGDVVVVTDGAWTGRDPLLSTAVLQRAGLRVHAAPVGADRTGDSAVVRIVGPPRVGAGQPVQLGVEVWAAKAGPGLLQVRDRAGTALLATPQEVALEAGRNTLTLEVAAPTGAALVDLDVEVAVEGDPEPANGVARFVSEVVGGPRVRVVTRGGVETSLVAALRSALAASGTPLDLVSHEGWSPSLAALGRDAAIVLEDVPLSGLGDGADRTLARYVDETGGGLLVLGGSSSFANGGYFHSALEPLLPVSLDRPEDLRRPAVAVGIVLDRSGSMSVGTGFGPTKMDFADQSAVAAIQLLEPGDAVMVMAVDEAAHLVVPLQELGLPEERAAIIQRTLAIESMGGGIYLDAALRASMYVLQGSDAVNRHLVLFSDASDTEEPGEYKELIGAWTRAGFTLSVVGLGTDRDPDAGLLKEVASLGGGRIYFTQDARRLPTLFAEDVMQVAANSWIRDPVAVAQVPAASSLGIRAPASIGGHHLTMGREKAEIWWVTADEEAAPLLAGWPHGAGRVLAAPFAVSGPDAAAFPSWPSYRDLVRALVEWVRRPEGRAEIVADVTVHGGTARVSVEVDPRASWARAPELVVVGPDDQLLPPVPLSWDGPGRLVGQFPLDGPGLHSGVVRIGTEVVRLPPVVLPQSPEVALDPDAAQRRSTLVALAQATGGSALFTPEALGGPRAVAGGRRLAGALAALALALLLAEIAQRRGLLAPLEAWAAARLPAIPRRPTHPRAVPTVAVEPEIPAEAPPAPAPDPLAEARKRARGRGPR